MAASEVFCEDFVDSSCENAFFSGTRRLYIAVTYLFFYYSCILFVKYLLTIDGTFLINYFRMLVKDLTVYYLTLKSAIMENSWNCINLFRLFYNFRTKSTKNSRDIMRCQGYFFKNCSGDWPYVLTYK